MTCINFAHKCKRSLTFRQVFQGLLTKEQVNPSSSRFNCRESVGNYRFFQDSIFDRLSRRSQK
jgi:hypothetical protein